LAVSSSISQLSFTSRVSSQLSAGSSCHTMGILIRKFHKQHFIILHLVL
jgi:hypothetical protein